MTPTEFIYWLDGLVALSPEPPSPEHWEAIKNNLAEARKHSPRPLEGWKKTGDKPAETYRPGAHDMEDHVDARSFQWGY